MPEQRQGAPDPTEHWAFSDGASGLLFNRQSMHLFPVEADAAQTLDAILRQVDQVLPGSPEAAAVAEILAAFNAQALPNPLEGLLALGLPPASGAAPEPVASKPLRKLALNVANDCNLACSYCYANKGTYGTPDRSLLLPDDAERYVERLAGRFDRIDTVQFMGGEPSMNHAAIRRVGTVFRRLVNAGTLLREPHYTLVTNGLALSRPFLEVCQEMRIELTVSLDGPERVHDAARVRRNGRGSYAAVRRGIDRARDAGLTLGFEPTFSRAHLGQGMSLIDLVEWFHAEFGVTTLHAPPMSENRYESDGLGLSPQEKMREYCAVTEWGIDNLLVRKRYLLHTFTMRILASLETRKRQSHLCPAGNALLSVSVSGDIAPCWMYTDEPLFDMGHVDDAEFPDAKAHQVADLLDRNELQSHPACRHCVIQPLCFGCKSGDYHATGTPSGKSDCDAMRAMVVTAMMRIHSHPDQPMPAAAYYARPSFGEGIHMGLRPAGPGPAA